MQTCIHGVKRGIHSIYYDFYPTIIMIIVKVFKVLIVVSVLLYLCSAVSLHYRTTSCSMELLQYLSPDSKRRRKDTDEEKSKKGYYKETFITSQTLKVLPLEPKSIKKNERLYVKEANGKLKRK